MAVTTTNLGVITAYGDAVAAGYTGTKAEWQALMASYATVGQQAVDAKNDAVAAKNTAVTKATEATTAATTATTKASEASASAQSIAQSAAQIQENTDDIEQLMSDLTALAPKDDMFKAFPTDTASGSVASFADGANVPVKSLIVNIDPVQSGSGDPSPTNVRSISGWTEANIAATGINIWDEEMVMGTYNSATTTVVITSSDTEHLRSKNPIIVKPNTTYYMYTHGFNVHIIVADADGNVLYRSTSLNNASFTTPSNAAYVYFNTAMAYGTTYNHDISINYPPTNHDYHPYSGQSINIVLGQTVYGGTLDVTNGVLTIDRTLKTLNGTESWSIMDNVAGCFDTTAISASQAYPTVVCDIYKNAASYNAIRATNSSIAIGTTRTMIHDDRFTTVADFKSNLASNPIHFVMPLATPTTVQLTPHEVTALLGSNNVWADSGDSEVTYRADPTLYIGRLTEPDTDMVADANIVSGQYFMVGNTLYKATANIASGGTITPNVNCTRKSLSEALNELNA